MHLGITPDEYDRLTIGQHEAIVREMKKRGRSGRRRRR